MEDRRIYSLSIGTIHPGPSILRLGSTQHCIKVFYLYEVHQLFSIPARKAWALPRVKTLTDAHRPQRPIAPSTETVGGWCTFCPHTFAQGRPVFQSCRCGVLGPVRVRVAETVGCDQRCEAGGRRATRRLLKPVSLCTVSSAPPSSRFDIILAFEIFRYEFPFQMKRFAFLCIRLSFSLHF